MTDLILVHKLYVSWIYLILPSQKVDTIIIPKFQFWISVKLPQEMNRRCLSMTLSILRFSRTILKVLFFSFFNFYFYLVLLYNTVLVLPYIDMNPPRVYMQSQTRMFFLEDCSICILEECVIGHCWILYGWLLVLISL